MFTLPASLFSVRVQVRALRARSVRALRAPNRTTNRESNASEDEPSSENMEE
jgi:hypothetical protein